MGPVEFIHPCSSDRLEIFRLGNPIIKPCPSNPIKSDVRILDPASITARFSAGVDITVATIVRAQFSSSQAQADINDLSL